MRIVFHPYYVELHWGFFIFRTQGIWDKLGINFWSHNVQSLARFGASSPGSIHPGPGQSQEREVLCRGDHRGKMMLMMLMHHLPPHLPLPPGLGPRGEHHPVVFHSKGWDDPIPHPGAGTARLTQHQHWEMCDGTTPLHSLYYSICQQLVTYLFL